MSRKRDPITTVLDYFQDAELPLAQQALTLATQIVRKRQPKATNKARASRAKPASAPATPPPVN